MTLRAKTRSRKSRDLKRLDGVRRRTTRRRLRNQRGGAAPVASFADWLTAVKKENSVYKTRTDPEREDYSISLIKNDSDNHQLPLFNGENMDKFKMPNGADVRGAAANVASMLKLIMNKTPTIGQFQNEMRVQLQPGADALASADVQAQLQVLAGIEHTLRDFGNGDSTPSTKEISATTDILTDVNAYPLYIWALYYSAPEKEDISVPILTPPEKVASEVGSSEVSKLSEPTDTMP